MLKGLHSKKGLQLFLGLLMGIGFGFFLQKGGVTKYTIIINQLLLKDFTVLKIMLTAAATGMVGVYAMKWIGLTELHPKPGSVGMNIVGGTLFGIGFAVLGYCPGTVAGAAGNGYLDGAIGGILGIWFGAGLFAAFYSKLNAGILNKGYIGDVTFPKLLKLPEWLMVIIFAGLILGGLYLLELNGL